MQVCYFTDLLIFFFFYKKEQQHIFSFEWSTVQINFPDQLPIIYSQILKGHK